MDFSYSDDQQAILELARQILSDHCTQEALQRAEQRDDARFDPELWQKLGEAGLIGAGLPEQYGGGGLGFLEVAGIVEQLGVTAAPVPFLESVVLGALPLAAYGSPEQQEEWLPRVSTGAAILTAALVEPLREHDDPGTRARRDGEDFVLSGEKICVPAGQLADGILVPARLGDALAVFLVRTDLPGVSREKLATTSGQPESTLVLEDARVGAPDVLGDVTQGAEIIEWIELRATAALACLASGACQEALRLTAEYTKTRKQFDQAIATFQAVGQRAADMYIDTEAIRITAQQAAWRIHEGLDARAEVAVTKAWAADGGARVTRAALHLHGGIGVDREYALHRYYLYARHIELSLGGETKQLRKLGRLLSGEAT